ncbi:MAG: S1 family peptidase, partial [Solirubrobacterales bacterium]
AALCAVALAAAAALPAAPADAGDRRAVASIIGGQRADPAQWPFAAAVFFKGKFHCSGSVIAPTKVLTAAHCVDGFKPSRLAVIVGRLDHRHDPGGAVFGAVAATPHPDFHKRQIHDAGVITLDAATTAPPVLLPTADEAATYGYPGQLLRVAGWGARHPFGINLSTALRSATEQIRTDRRCRRAYRRLYVVTTMICATGRRLQRFGRPPIHETACSGDSGAPLVADTARGAVVIGTVSFGGAFCGFGATPTVYSRVSDSLEFIVTA